MSTIHELIPQIMAKVGAITKERKNAQQGYVFRGIDDAYFAFQPVFAELGVFVVPKVLKVTREEREAKSGGVLIYTTLEVQHTFFAKDGSSFEAVTIGEAMDSGDKSSNKAMSAAMKYALLEVFCVPTKEDNDTENHSPEPRPRQTASASAPATSERPAQQNSPTGTKERSGATVARWQDYVLTGSKNKGKKLGELGEKQIQWYIENWDVGKDTDCRYWLNEARQQLAGAEQEQPADDVPF